MKKKLYCSIGKKKCWKYILKTYNKFTGCEEQKGYCIHICHYVHDMKECPRGKIFSDPIIRTR